MSENDQNPQDWVGRTENCDDTLDPGHIEKIAAALDVGTAHPGDPLPALWHWGLFVRPEPYAGLGRDGHPERGGFLPPATGCNRMWAGGRVDFIHPLLVGTPAQRRSTIAAVTEKQGRSGRLLFVTVSHEYVQDFVVCLREAQDIVYREPAPPVLQGREPAPEAQWSQEIVPSTTMLFRYSAVTFNGHRIHYDQDYVTREEGYPGLVVHGPLIATLMCQAFRHAHRGHRLLHMNYRGLRPLIAPRPFQVEGRLVADSDEGHGQAELWAQQDGMLAHRASIRFEGDA